jgi:DNA (cytosine-5)-methyltransferase 1
MPIIAADLFCGAGGTSTGLLQAADSLGRSVRLTAVNHWDLAIATHTENHPTARHLCASLDSLDPRPLFPKGIDLLWASPECTHHSRARGDAPINDQSRATAWCVVRWAEAVKPKHILVENVPEFQEWGAVGHDGKPLKSKKGQTFMAWVAALQSIGYRVEWQVLCSADYGDPTERNRLFVQAVRGKRKIVWPEPTHINPKRAGDMLCGNKPLWRGAIEGIDLTLPSQSIYTRERPLSKKTISRIWNGMRKYNQPFVVAWDNHSSGNADRSINEPLTTVVTKARHGVVQPFLVPYYGRDGQHAIESPLPTVTTENRFGLVQPYLINYYGNGATMPLDEPLDTITTVDRFGLVQPIVERAGQKYMLDVHFRMLQPEELAICMGFPRGYKFDRRKKYAVKQIGNAVPVNTARALCAEAIKQL